LLLMAHSETTRPRAARRMWGFYSDPGNLRLDGSEWWARLDSDQEPDRYEWSDLSEKSKQSGIYCRVQPRSDNDIRLRTDLSNSMKPDSPLKSSCFTISARSVISVSGERPVSSAFRLNSL